MVFRKYNKLYHLFQYKLLTKNINISKNRFYSSLPSWATVDPYTLSSTNIGEGYNLLNGKWFQPNEMEKIIDPLNGEIILKMPLTSSKYISSYVDSLKSCPKSGLHNPLKNIERYLLFGDISAKAASKLRDEKIINYFIKLIQRVSPKSYDQAYGEVKISRIFFENFSGDQVRFLSRSFSIPGDHYGQQSNGYRWPYGPVALITPFNFPLEIPILQLMGALYMGNKVLVKVDTKVSIVMQEFLRFLHIDCGLPLNDVDMIHSNGNVMNELLLKLEPRNTLFTGSSKIAQKLAKELNGKIKVEDAGFDWKILGPDVLNEEYVAYQCDQDAYACQGQKCSAQSILFMHENWIKQYNIEKKLALLASKRNLKDLTIGPVLTVTTKEIIQHIHNLLKLPGARIAFGGKELKNHTIPTCYGAIEPTAIFVPLKEIILNQVTIQLVTKEIFGPFQIITEYNDNDIDTILYLLEKMEAHLTAAIVSNDILFTNKILSKTVNGTTYSGIRARTTGAPQNHWFGPAGDPRAGGIGSPEAIQMVWSCHREIIYDYNPMIKDTKLLKQS